METFSSIFIMIFDISSDIFCARIEKVSLIIEKAVISGELAMSLSERNLFVEILNKNGATRREIEIIMNDVKEVFPEEEFYDDLDPLDIECDEIFNEKNKESDIEYLTDISLSEKMKQAKIAKQNAKIFSDRLIEKQKEVREHERNIPDEEGKEEADVSTEKSVTFVALRYGRSPLHEAMAIGDLKKVEYFIKSGEFLDYSDNNGYTPKEMAYHLGYKEVIKLFKLYKK